MSKNKDICRMREALVTVYPSGMIRGQLIADMSDSQVYAIYKSHTKRRISMKKPRLRKPEKQIPGQLNMLAQM